MSNTITAEAGEAAAVPAAAVENGAGAEAGPIGAIRREAATYRRRLRDVEAERDTLLTQVQGLQRAEAERVATSRADGFRPLVDAADLWRGTSVGLDALVTEEGRIDVARVRDAVAAIGAEHPHWLTPAPWGELRRRQGLGAHEHRDGSARWRPAICRWRVAANPSGLAGTVSSR